jgi:hypothetical protein
MVITFRRFWLTLLGSFWLFAATNPAFAQHQGHAMKPALATGAAFSPDGAVWVSGVEQGMLFVQRQDSHSRQWGERQFLPTEGEQVATSGDNRPKIIFGPRDLVIVTYTHPLSKPYTGEIRMLRSEDGGKHFSAPFTVHADRQIITHRFESVQFDARGDLYTVWVDKRDAERVWQAHQGDQRSYEGAAIYYNISRDGGVSFEEDRKLADSSCECCRIALLAEPDAGIVAMWRHVFAGSVRDHAFARVNAGSVSQVARASRDNWELKACPHHGPGLAHAGAGNYHAVWFGEKEGQQRVRYGLLDHDGNPLGKVRALPDERAEHADIVSSGKTVVIVWRSFDGKATRLGAWISQDSGKNFTKSTLMTTELENDYPRLIEHAGKIAVVWRTVKETHVHHLVQ